MSLHFRGGESGFTIIELLVVIIIIGILVAVSAPKYDHAIYATKVYSHLSNVRNILDKAEAYSLLREMQGKDPYPHFSGSHDCGTSNLWEWTVHLGLTGWGDSPNPLAFDHPPICPLNGKPYAFTDCAADVDGIRACDKEHAHLIYYLSPDDSSPPVIVFCKPDI